MISAKFLGRRGGTTANAVKALDYLTDLKSRHGIDLVATNNSWGGGGFSQSLQDAITRSGNADILFIAAAGNGGGDGVGEAGLGECAGVGGVFAGGVLAGAGLAAGSGWG